MAGALAGAVHVAGGVAVGHALFGEELIANLHRLGAPPMTGADAARHIALRLLAGMVTTFVYVLALPRLGRGWRAALAASLATWLAAYPVFLFALVDLSVLSPRTALLAGAWGLVEGFLAALAGARAYRE
jgi:hypothetical protein